MSQLFVPVYGGIDHPVRADRPFFSSAMDTLNRLFGEFNRWPRTEKYPISGNTRQFQHFWTRCRKDKGDRSFADHGPPTVAMKMLSVAGDRFPSEEGTCEFQCLAHDPK